MDSIITYLLIYNQYLINIMCELILFISQHIILNKTIFDDSNSPKYQKFKIYKLPEEKVDYKLLLAYYKHKYNKIVKFVQIQNSKSIPEKIKYPKCCASNKYIYDNNVNKFKYKCRICNLPLKETNYTAKQIFFTFPYYDATLTEQKQRNYFKIHKCNYSKYSYYKNNLKKLTKNINSTDKYKYKLHYIFREFNINFFKIYSYPT